MLVVQTPAVWTVEAVPDFDISASSESVSALSQLVAIPLREVYAVLWRLGVLDIDE
ncbi:Rv1535 domain-containing protein [Mycobacterium sp. ITM-2016-00317]|uniref:Rv1535 domain-containing protein n=1 Tax=Mycobacterium sp. ITM-2016-00317 TaxID=2099694 RepID=UPI0037C98395